MVGLLTLFCCWDKSKPLWLSFLNSFEMEIFAFIWYFPVRNRIFDKREDKYESFESDTLSKKITYGESRESNEIKKDRANEEFKRLLCKQIPKEDKIWSDGDKFDIKKFVKEPYLSIVNEIASNAKTFYLISAICIAFLTFFHHYLGHWRFIRLIFLTS